MLNSNEEKYKILLFIVNFYMITLKKKIRKLKNKIEQL